jgi:hypothetical protein
MDEELLNIYIYIYVCVCVCVCVCVYIFFLIEMKYLEMLWDNKAFNIMLV